jgi:hypothetical protein
MPVPRWRGRALGTVLVLLLVLGLSTVVPAAAGPAPAEVAVALPAGKANYTVSVMSDQYKNAWVRLAQYTFAADGRVSESFWYWHNHTFIGDGYTNKVSSGYATHGCQRLCTVRTPRGFQPGAAPRQLTGRFRWDANRNLIIDWPGGHQEAWRVTSMGSYARLDIITSNYGVTQGSWGFGSNAPFTTGATIDQIMAAGELRGAGRSNRYGATDVTANFRLALNQFDRCAASPCIMGNAPQLWIAYLANNPARDGRKVFYDNELAEVAGSSPCTANPHGHTMALLQVLDDSGRFRGLVGVEASLHVRLNGGAIVASVYALRQN